MAVATVFPKAKTRSTTRLQQRLTTRPVSRPRRSSSFSPKRDLIFHQLSKASQKKMIPSLLKTSATSAIVAPVFSVKTVSTTALLARVATVKFAWKRQAGETVVTTPGLAVSTFKDESLPPRCVTRELRIKIMTRTYTTITT